MLAQQFLAGGHDNTQAPDARGDQATAAQMPNSDCDVGVRIDEIDIAVRLYESDSNLGVKIEKLIDDRQYAQTRNLHRCRNNKLAARGCKFAGGTTLLLINLFQDLLGGRDVEGSGISKLKLSC